MRQRAFEYLDAVGLEMLGGLVHLRGRAQAEGGMIQTDNVAGIGRSGVGDLVEADIMEGERLSFTVLSHVQPDDVPRVFAGYLESEQVPVEFQRPLQVCDVKHDVGDIDDFHNCAPS